MESYLYLYACPYYRWFIVQPHWWGLLSVARDYQSDILRAMAKNLTLVHDGEYSFCPLHPERYLNCFWEDFNGCQLAWRNSTEKPRLEQEWRRSIQPIELNEFPEWLWENLRRSGVVYLRDGRTGSLIPMTDDSGLNQDMYLQLKISVLRAIMAKVVFKPRPEVIGKANDIVGRWKGNQSHALSGTGLAVHIRRTDKKEDLGAHWNHIDFKSALHMGLYIRMMERTLDTSFGHFLVMSDDPHMQVQATQELSSFFQENSTHALFSDSLCHFLGNSNHDNYTGHESLNATARHDLYVSSKMVWGYLL